MLPIPSPEEIEAGFEGRLPTPEQSQTITEIRAAMVLLAQQTLPRLNDNAGMRRCLIQLQQAFSSAKSSIMSPADPAPEGSESLIR